ncbi:zinc finger protein 570-like [Pomacea canaliculata]|uniref:zinc finger protein 570-like n=1 Tax=Pomacea canaliculata TaxID=400727 RepID=UPI000D7367D2|nr:zinc finger protein 570-like [Pomacea canaliculata]
MSAINNQVQVSCMHSIKTEPRSVTDLQEDLKDNVMLKTESTFCSETDMTYCSPISCMQLENMSAPAYIKHEHAWHIPESNCKREDAVKLELNPQGAIYCIKTEQVPDEELYPIKAKSAAHIEQSDCSRQNAVKVEYHCQDVTCSIKSEHDLVKCAKSEEQLVFKQEEQDDSHIVKTETGWPGPHAIWQNNIDENSLEMSVARCITPEVKENQHQTHPTFTEVTINTSTEIHKKQMMIHYDLKAYNCTPCSVVLERIDTLQQHKETNSNKRSHHNDERPHKCNVCHVAFTKSCYLKQHMVTHSDLKPHQCSICSSAFKLSVYLKKHMSIHRDEKPQECTVCHKAFKRLDAVKVHMVSHNNVRPYQCTICNNAFKLPGHLKQHMVTHSDVKPYLCRICRKTFRWSSHLTRHMLTHKDVTSPVPF